MWRKWWGSESNGASETENKTEDTTATTQGTTGPSTDASPRRGVGAKLRALFGAQSETNKQLWREVEDVLIEADFGVELAEQLVTKAKRRCKQAVDQHAVLLALKEEMLERLTQVPVQGFDFSRDDRLNLVLVVGVNGVGKTTTIGKLTRYISSQEKSVLLAAADTFRAAAIEQLQVWGERSGVTVVAQQPGADSAAVVFDACQAGLARDIPVVLADTAGRLHNKTQLMQELAKIKRVVAKLGDRIVVKTWLVIDATLGQNSLNQAKEFEGHFGVDGFVLTKMDGTAKGGMVMALTGQFGKPVEFVGVGEKLDDIRPFDAEAYVDGLLELSEPASPPASPSGSTSGSTST